MDNCSSCHTTVGWDSASFNHNATGFPLVGTHAATPCVQCHVNNNFKSLPTDCGSCHMAQYRSTTNPPHAASGFPTDCSLCHTTSSWAGATFDHSKTAFPLTGAHTSVACGNCHVNNNFKSLPTDCGSCHMAQYKATTNPPHAASGFPTDCSLCHTTASWAGATFNRAAIPPPISRERQPTAIAATRRSTTPPTIRPTSRPGSRALAPIATPPPAGPVHRSITPSSSFHTTTPRAAIATRIPRTLPCSFARIVIRNPKPTRNTPASGVMFLTA